MAEVAYWVRYPGEIKELVNASDITEAQRHEEFRCAGKNNRNEPCNCRVRPYFRSSGTYFKVVEYDKHIRMCCNDETPRTRLLKKLDFTGGGKSLDDIFNGLSDAGTTADIPSGSPAKKNERTSHAVTKAEEMLDLRDVVVTLKPPSTVREIAVACVSEPLDYKLFDIPIKDLIIDMRTFNYYHEHGVAPGSILLAPMCKTNPSNFPIELKKASQKYLGFRDPFYKTMQTIYYAIPYSKPIADIVFASKDNKNFVVLAKWRTIQTETNDRVFFADTVSKKMILPLKDSDSVLTISHFKSDLVSD